jgi:hypothetical protein
MLGFSLGTLLTGYDGQGGRGVGKSRGKDVAGI